MNNRSATRHLTESELLTWCDRESAEPDLPGIEAHLTGCSECSLRLEEYRQVYELAKSTAMTHHEFSSASQSAAKRELVAAMAEASQTRRPWLAGAERWALLPLTAAILFGVLWLLPHSRVVLAGSVPQTRLTPGEALPIAKRELCANGFEGQTAVPVSLQRAVFTEYGMPHARPADYEVDYLITPQLGGATTLRNLWPEPYSARWNARVKDQLEARLHEMVCSGQMDLRTAQQEIATDWVAAYRKYFRTRMPLKVD